MPPGLAVAAGPEVRTPPSDDHPVQVVPSHERVQRAPSLPRMKVRTSPVPWAATAGASSTTSAGALAAGSATSAHTSAISPLRLARPTEVTQVLTREADHEARVVAQVAPPQAPWLLGEPERPLQPKPLQRFRRLALEAGVEVEGGADADEHRRLEALAHHPHELLLQR